MAIATDKVIFYHIPKTGGIWVTNVMQRLFKYSFKRLSNESPEELGLFAQHDSPLSIPSGDRFSFTFVRNPTSWYISRWAYSMWGGWKDTNVIGRELKSDDFNGFVNNCLDKYPNGMLSEIYRRFLRVDFIGRQENLREDLIRALKLGGEEFDIGLIGNSFDNESKPHLKELAIYNKETLKRLRKVEQFAYRRFRYA